MRSNRLAVQAMAVTVLLAAHGIGSDALVRPLAAQAAGTEEQLPAANTLSNLVVQQAEDGRWIASVQYAFTGKPMFTRVKIYQVSGLPDGNVPFSDRLAGEAEAQLGNRTYSVELPNPSAGGRFITRRVWAVLETHGRTPLATVSLDQRVVWQDPLTAEVDKAIAAGRPEAIVARAVELIDSDNDKMLHQARVLLQRLVEKQPRTDAAYIELARVAMKTQWNRAGRDHAEALLKSALDIQPQSANARILLGYVYAHQARHQEAEALFVQAAASNPPNLWLWANWAQLLAMQGRTDEAIAKYREALARPVTTESHDRARVDAYRRVQPLLLQRKDLDGLEALLKQSIRDYPDMGCFGIDYAHFQVAHRGNGAAALATLDNTPVGPCDATRGREVRALAHYVGWAKEPARTELLHQARAFMPVTSRLLYRLASSEPTARVIRQLDAVGEKIGQKDAAGFDALSHALHEEDAPAAGRLLQAGARPDAPVGPDGMPVALIAVLTGNAETIRLLQRAGVDYTQLRFRGITAVDHARSRGDTELLELLDPRAGRL